MKAIAGNSITELLHNFENIIKELNSMSKFFQVSATWCNKYYPLTIRRNTLAEAIETIKAILPGCTNIKEWRD